MWKGTPYFRWSFAEANNPIGMHYLQVFTALTIQPLTKKSTLIQIGHLSVRVKYTTKRNTLSRVVD